MAAQDQRDLALEVVKTLRANGFEALFAGGCVRDELLGRVPKDYDVATNATPDQIRRVFGRRRTLAIGAAFGVITVLGPPGTGQVEVATFRRDSTYSDGRHPDKVSFSDARQDALRRDFTINGLFYDPIKNEVIDYVGGQEDLRRGLIRAIGDPDKRFDEDKLRMLRAVRFAAAFEFQLEPKTLEAIRRRANEILVVSPERIAMEMRRILEDPHRAVGMRLLVETGLAAVILPEITRPHPNLPLEGERKLEINSPRASSPPNGEGEPETLLLQREKQDRGDDEASWRLTRSLAVIDRLDRPSFPLVLAAILYPHVDAEGAQEVGLRWRLSNQEIDRLTWLVAHHADLRAVRMKRWSELQPLLVAEGIEDLIALTEAERRVEGGDLEELAWLRSLLARPREELDPPPLLTGDDLIAHGIPPGPVYRTLLDRVRQAQLDGEIHTREEAIALVDRFLGES